MELTVLDESADISHVRLTGRMDPHGAQQVKDALRAQTSAQARPAIVDVTGVTFITSHGVGVLVDCGASVQRAGFQFAIVCRAGLVRTVLEKTGVTRIITVVDTVEEARRAVGV